MGYFSRVLVRPTSAHMDRNQMRCPLPIGRDATGQCLTGLGKYFTEFFFVFLCHFYLGSAVCQQQNGIVGTCMPINMNTVEAVLDRFFQESLCDCGIDGNIGEHNAEHRCHAGSDHGRTFSHPKQRGSLPLSLYCFGATVGRQHASSGRQDRFRIVSSHGSHLGNTGSNRVDRKKVSNDSGRHH